MTRFAALALFLCAAANCAFGRAGNDFYKGRTVELYIGYSVSVGGSDDI